MAKKYSNHKKNKKLTKKTLKKLKTLKKSKSGKRNKKLLQTENVKRTRTSLKSRTRNSRYSRKKDDTTEINLDMTDKSLQDFKSSKSITVATTKSDITSSKIGELYEVKPINENIQRLCQIKIAGKIAKEYPNENIPKHVSKQICKCLFEKNSNLRIIELEKLIKTRMETPASSCINILDKNSHHFKS